MKPVLVSRLFWLLLLFFLSACKGSGESQPRVPVQTPTISGAEYELITHILHPSLGIDQEQEIRVWIRRRGMPQINVQPVLALTLPDGSTQPYRLPPTDGNGETGLTIFPVSASRGTLIPFRVCLYLPQAEEKCVEDSYLIWSEK